MKRLLRIMVVMAIFLGWSFVMNVYAQEGSMGEPHYSEPRAESSKAKTEHKYHNTSVGKIKEKKQDLYEGSDPYTFDTMPEDGGSSTTSDFFGEADAVSGE